VEIFNPEHFVCLLLPQGGTVTFSVSQCFEHECLLCCIAHLMVLLEDWDIS